MSNVTISELIAEIGNDNVSVQNLRNDLTDCTIVKGVTKVSFGTDAITPNDVAFGSGKTALIVWCDPLKLESNEDS